jgi:hypothetical protein
LFLDQLPGSLKVLGFLLLKQGQLYIVYYFCIYSSIEAVNKRLQGTAAPPEIIKNLSTIEQRLLENYQLMFTRGKGGAKVAVLLPPDVIPTLKQISDLDVRRAVGVDSHLLFANSGTCNWKIVAYRHPCVHVAVNLATANQNYHRSCSIMM